MLQVVNRNSNGWDEIQTESPRYEPSSSGNNLYPVEPQEEKRYVILDFGGGTGLSYRGIDSEGEEISIDGIAVENSNRTAEEIDFILKELNARFAGSNIEFVLPGDDAPSDAPTIHVGKTDAFGGFGITENNFVGIYENGTETEGRVNGGFAAPGENLLIEIENIGRVVGGLFGGSIPVDAEKLPALGYQSTRISGPIYGFIFSQVPNSLFWCTSTGAVNGTASLRSGVTVVQDNGGSFQNVTLNTGARFFAAGSVGQLSVVDGWFFLYEGGNVTSASVSGGVFRVTGGSALDTVVSGSGTMYLEAMPNEAGGTMTGSASGIRLISGGALHIDGGEGTGIHVSDGGIMNVYAGRASDSVLSSGGLQNVFDGAALDGVLFAGGTQFVRSGAVVAGMSVDDGLQAVEEAGLADGTLLGSGGVMSVHTGGSARDFTVESGGIVYLDGGAEIYGSARIGGSMHLSGSVDPGNAAVILELASRNPGDGVMINDLSLLAGGISEIRTGGQLAAGTWLLAGNAAVLGSSLSISFSGEGVDSIGGFSWLAGAARYSGAAEGDSRLALRYNASGELELLVHERYVLLGNETQEYVADDVSYTDMRNGEQDSFYARLVASQQYRKSIYGGGSLADHSGTISIDIENGAVLSGYLFGGGYGRSVGATRLTFFEGATGGGYLFGGGRDGNVTGSAVVDIQGGVVDNLVGGGLAAAGNASVTAVILSLGAFSAAGTNSFVIGGGMVTAAGRVSHAGSVTVTVDSCSASYLHGGGYSTGGTASVDTVSITVNSGSISGYLYGGGRADGNGAVTVTGDTVLNITSGTISHVFGGGYAERNGTSRTEGDISITVTGGSFSGTVYGGAQVKTDGSGIAGVDGDINITIDVSGENTVEFTGRQGITTGGTTLSYVTGNTALTLTGSGGNLKTDGGAFSGWLSASNCGTDPAKQHTLRFADYTDMDFQARVRGFNNLAFEGESIITVSANMTWMSGIDFTFDLSGRESSLFDTAFLTQKRGGLGINRETEFIIRLSYREIQAAGGETGSFELIDGMNRNWEFGDDVVRLTYEDEHSGPMELYANVGETILLPDSGMEFTLEYDAGRLVLSWYSDGPIDPSPESNSKKQMALA